MFILEWANLNVESCRMETVDENADNTRCTSRDSAKYSCGNTGLRTYFPFIFFSGLPACVNTNVDANRRFLKFHFILDYLDIKSSSHGVTVMKLWNDWTKRLPAAFWYLTDIQILKRHSYLLTCLLIYDTATSCWTS